MCVRVCVNVCVCVSVCVCMCRWQLTFTNVAIVRIGLLSALTATDTPLLYLIRNKHFSRAQCAVAWSLIAPSTLAGTGCEGRREEGGGGRGEGGGSGVGGQSGRSNETSSHQNLALLFTLAVLADVGGPTPCLFLGTGE